jgi:hypothetical protein
MDTVPHHLLSILLQTDWKIHILPTFITWIDADGKYISTCFYFVRFELKLVQILIFWISKTPELAGRKNQKPCNWNNTDKNFIIKLNPSWLWCSVSLLKINIESVSFGFFNCAWSKKSLYLQESKLRLKHTGRLRDKIVTRGSTTSTLQLQLQRSSVPDSQS